jgi:transposase-like protein
VAGWRASGKSARAYAAEHGYSEASLYKWAAQLREPRGGSANLGFVRLTVQREPPTDLEVCVGCALIRVRRGFDPELLRQVVEALSVRRLP